MYVELYSKKCRFVRADRTSETVQHLHHAPSTSPCSKIHANKKGIITHTHRRLILLSLPYTPSSHQMPWQQEIRNPLFNRILVPTAPTHQLPLLYARLQQHAMQIPRRLRRHLLHLHRVFRRHRI
jgi:hypothetical protein